MYGKWVKRYNYLTMTKLLDLHVVNEAKCRVLISIEHIRESKPADVKKVTICIVMI